MLPDIAPLLALRRFLTIVHHVPGRIRIKMSMAALGHLPELDPAPFLAVVGRIRGVKATRVNPAALSVAIEYDQDIIPTSLWHFIITASKKEIEDILARYVV